MDIEIHQIPKDLKLSLAQLKSIIVNTCRDIDLAPLSISYIFVSDSELAEIHGTFLNDSSATDIITFNLGHNAIEGEIYISAERAGNNAADYNVRLEEEIVRLLIHGILHLAGYDDIEEQDSE